MSDRDIYVYSHTSEHLATQAQAVGIAALLTKPVPFYTVVNNGTLDDLHKQLEGIALYNSRNVVLVSNEEQNED